MMRGKQARWHIFFSGKVQQVGFRYTAHYLARGLGVSGWVDNLPDGRVEMEAQGDVSALRKLIVLLKSQPHIHIERMEIEPFPCSAETGLLRKPTLMVRRPNSV